MKGHHFRRNRTLGGQPRTCTVKCTLVAALLLFVAGVSTGCNKGSDTPAATVEKPKQAQSIPAVPQVVFGIEQNDSGGHKGVPWGTDQGSMKLKSDDGFCSEDGSKLVAKLVGPPLLSGEDVEMSNELNKMGVANVPPSIPPKMPNSLSFSSDDSGSCLGFVDEKFALAITYIGTAQQDQGRALTQISQKYQKAGTVQENDWGELHYLRLILCPQSREPCFEREAQIHASTTCKGVTETILIPCSMPLSSQTHTLSLSRSSGKSRFSTTEPRWQNRCSS